MLHHSHTLVANKLVRLLVIGQLRTELQVSYVFTRRNYAAGNNVVQ